MSKLEKNERESASDEFVLLGFRSGVKWKKAVSIIYLFFCIIGLLSELFLGNNKNINPGDSIVSKIDCIITFLMLLSPYAVLSESPLRDKIPFFEKRKITSTIIGLIILGLVFCGIKAIVSSFYTDEYKEKYNVSEEKKSAEPEAGEKDEVIPEPEETSAEPVTNDELAPEDDVAIEEPPVVTPSEEPPVIAEQTEETINTPQEVMKVAESETSTGMAKITESEKETVVYNGSTVYITPTGKKYHYSSSCAGKNAIEKSLDDIKNSYEPCKKCVQ